MADPLFTACPESITPWQALLAIADWRCPLFFDSALREPRLGRYSFVTGDPFAILIARGNEVRWVPGPPLTIPSGLDALGQLQWVLRQYRGRADPDLPPFQGGAAGLFSYDLCHHLERLLRPQWDEFQVPDLAIGLYDWVLAFDHVRRKSWVVSTGWPESDRAARFSRRKQRTEAVLERLAAGVPHGQAKSHALERACHAPAGEMGQAIDGSSLAPQYPLPIHAGVTSNFSRAGYQEAIARVIEYIHAGDCFQVNLSQRLLYPLAESPLRLYWRLRQRNPAPFAGYFDLGEFAIASSSPERFLRVTAEGDVETRPIKGTRPRRIGPEADRAEADRLRQSAKDRAENVMIVDLLRNDLGRVCRYGSIRVPAVCEVESYETVHHLVSTIQGVLRPEHDAIDLLRASFPGGSVTGAPKVRAMEIIAELEPTARGAYCGCLGYLGFDGAMDANILIRSFTAGRGWIQFPVGGGIVAESDPDREYEETLHKASGLLRALKEGRD